jgi:hypothetical protein
MPSGEENTGSPPPPHNDPKLSQTVYQVLLLSLCSTTGSPAVPGKGLWPPTVMRVKVLPPSVEVETLEITLALRPRESL